MEIDEGFFAVRTSKEKRASLKRGRGSQRQAKILVMAESELVEKPQKHAKNRLCGRFRMKVIPDTAAETITAEARRAISSKASILTDNFSAYCQLKENFAEHTPVRDKGAEAAKLLPWVHTAISNAKRLLLGIFHGVSEKYMQYHLDEFCYKLNRRYQGEARFEILLGNSLKHWNENHWWQRTG